MCFIFLIVAVFIQDNTKNNDLKIPQHISDSQEFANFPTLIESGPGKFKTDHQLDSYLSYDQDKLYVQFNWTDDNWDIIQIPKDSVRWKSERGRGDRMYFYDNVGIRLFWDDQYYEIWFTANDQSPFQWNHLASMNSDDKPFNYQENLSQIKAEWISKEKIRLCVSIPWKALDINPTDHLKLSIQLIGTDSDSIGLDLADKRQLIKYKHQKIDVKLTD